MSIAKGYIKDDYTYVYTCGNCGGVGFHANTETCNHCYNLDMAQLMEAFAVARGERYYALLKAILSVIGKDICEYAISHKREGDKLLVIDLCNMLDVFKFPDNRMKPMVEWLEETELIPSGAYQRLQDKGMKVKTVLQQAREVRQGDR